MSLDAFTSLYLDWVNNFLTVDSFASHHNIPVKKAQRIIELGREVSNLTLDDYPTE